jgi:hypothetical protein
MSKMPKSITRLVACVCTVVIIQPSCVNSKEKTADKTKITTTEICQ